MVIANRREVLVGALAIAALGVTACGNDEVEENTGGDCAANGTVAVIGSNHGHELVVSKEDVAAGAEKTYNILGTSTHNHTVVISAADFGKLKNNQSLSLTSSSDTGHDHSVTVRCA